MNTENAPTGTPVECLVGPDLILDFLHRLATCHACGCSLVFDIGLPHCMDCAASCEEEHEPLTDKDYQTAIECVRKQADVIVNLSKLVQRLSRKCAVESLKRQAIGYLDRHGLNQHSILR